MLARLTMSIFILAASILAAGCAGNAAKRRDAEAKQISLSFDQLMADADHALREGQRDQALGLLFQASKLSPTSPDPWLHVAQIQFDSAHYIEAMVAAQEVRQRDATGNLPLSILAVSGLRLSVQSLADLRGKDFLSGDVRREAETLAITLRDTLGETVLIPPPVDDRQNTAKAPRKRSAKNTGNKRADASVSKPTMPPSSGDPARKQASKNESLSGNPFGALR